jgi:inner membrane transporter RhtA
MAIAAMACVQLGIAASVGLAPRIGAEGIVWLRLTLAGLVLIAIGRLWRASFTRSVLWTCAVLGVVTAGMSMLFMAAVMRLPLGTASALEFLGPLGVALARGRGVARSWAGIAAAGVLLLTEPWQHGVDLPGVVLALAAAVGWGSYIVLTERAGDGVTGVRALGVSMPIAALVCTFIAGPSAFGRLTWSLVGIGLGLALLMPVIPFSLELLALRRLTTAAFGTLMSLEPAIALTIGLIVLGQIPAPTAAAGVVLVVAAGIGADRTGARGDRRLELSLGRDRSGRVVAALARVALEHESKPLVERDGGRGWSHRRDRAAGGRRGAQRVQPERAADAASPLAGIDREIQNFGVYAVDQDRDQPDATARNERSVVAQRRGLLEPE